MTSDPFTDPPEFQAFKKEIRDEFVAWRNDNPRRPWIARYIQVRVTPPTDYHEPAGRPDCNG